MEHMEISEYTAQEYLASHPGTSLQEYIDSVKAANTERKAAYKGQCDKHIAWVRENLMGKHILIRVEQQVTMLTVKEDENKRLDLLIEYEFSTDMAGWSRSGVYPLKHYHLSSGGNGRPFALKWIKSPHNCPGNMLDGIYKSYSAYVVPDENWDEMAKTFKEYTERYEELAAFEDDATWTPVF